MLEWGPLLGMGAPACRKLQEGPSGKGQGQPVTYMGRTKEGTRPWRQPEVRGPKDKGLTQLLLCCGREACCAEGDRYPVLGEPGDRWG